MQFLKYLSSRIGTLLVLMFALGCFPLRLIAQAPATAPIPKYELLEQAAIAGEPFGVGHLSLFLDEYRSDIPPRIAIVETGDRIFYPSYNLRTLPAPGRIEPAPPTRPFGRGGLVERLRNAVASARHRTIQPVAVDIDFLFIGSEPLSVKVNHPDGSIEVPIVVRSAAPGSNEIVNQSQRWLDAYSKAARRDIAIADYSPIFQTFMVETMARRLKLSPPNLRSENQTSDDIFSQPLSTLELLGNAERLKDQVFRDTLRVPVRRADDPVSVSLPVPPTWVASPVPDAPDSLPIESIATSVPPECFYMRYGRFSNYLWFRELSAGRGAGLARMVTVRGSDSGANSKIERMLNTKTTLLAKLFGDSVIGDMAIIGHDLYLQDGAALGVLFEAKDIARLQSSLDAERKATAEKLGKEGVQLDELEIAGRKVSLLSNRDHSIRSFRVVDDKYLFLTTSRTLVERFLEVRDGGESLAQTPNFRYAKLILPVQNNYDVFGYFSPQFFQHLMSPQYNIELRRRCAAKSRIAAATMASLLAEAEKIPHQDLDDLIKADLLPAWFEETADGSQLIWDKDRWVDSRRGGIGAMLPISDVIIEDCAPSEADRYRQEMDFYTSQWNSTEPIMFGLRRFKSGGEVKTEQLAIEAYAAPLDFEKFGKWSRYLAEPIDTFIAQPPDDVVSAQVHMAGQNILGSNSPNNVLFAGLKDSTLPMPKEQPGIIETWQTLRSIPFYLGAWPQPRYLDQLPLGLGGSRPDINGFSRALIGMWRWQGAGFSVISFDRSILENAIGYLQPTPAPDPAQMRLAIKDLENTQLASSINEYFYRRAYSASRGNLRLLDAMQQQFKLTGLEAFNETEYLMDTHLICPLGGKYAINDSTASVGRNWDNDRIIQSSSIDPMQITIDELEPPLDYKVEWLGWMRGLQAHLTQAREGVRLLANIELEVLPQPELPLDTSALPTLNFDLFNLPSKFFGSGKTEETKAVDPKPQRSF